MCQNPCKTLGFKKNMVYKIPPGGGGGKPYPASGLHVRKQPIIALYLEFLKQPIIELYFEFETVLKFYKLKAWWEDRFLIKMWRM